MVVRFLFPGTEIMNSKVFSVGEGIEENYILLQFLIELSSLGLQ